MLSLVIVDDERSIIDLIKNLIDPKQTDAQVVGEAENGVDAYNVILQVKPDVVITDIRMPGMTGIELIEKINQVCPGITFVVISGYRDFEYAQNALKFGAIDYLLKPIKQKDLNNLLEQLEQKKSRAVDHEVKVKSMQEQLEVSTCLLRRNLLWDLIVGNPDQVSKALATIKSKEVFHFEPGLFCMAVVKIDSSPDVDAVNFPAASVETVAETVSRRLRPDCFDTEYVINKTAVYLLLNYLPGRHMPLAQKEHTLRDLIQDNSYKYPFLQLTISLGTEESEAAQIPRSCRTAWEALRHRVDLGCGRIFNFNTLNVSGDESPILSEPGIKRLRKSIESLNRKECLDTVHQLVDEYLRVCAGSACGLYHYCEDLLHRMDDIAFEFTQEHAIDPERMTEGIENATTVAGIEQVCISEASGILNALIAEKGNQLNRPVQMIKSYVQENYAQPISLEEVAALVHFSPVYVSSVFKKVTGSNFSNYLTEVRIEQAKNLLRTSFTGIAEIARQVGYNDARHFSKLFIKTVGIKPIEYRKFFS